MFCSFDLDIGRHRRTHGELKASEPRARIDPRGMSKQTNEQSCAEPHIWLSQCECGDNLADVGRANVRRRSLASDASSPQLSACFVSWSLRALGASDVMQRRGRTRRDDDESARAPTRNGERGEQYDSSGERSELSSGRVAPGFFRSDLMAEG